MKKKTISRIVAIIVALIILGGITVTVKNILQSDTSENDTRTNSETTKIPALKIVEVTYTAQGFKPATTTVVEGQTVEFINKSNNYFWPASNDHPSHKVYSDFDSNKPVIPGQTYSFTFEKIGTWNYHNHLNPTQVGAVIVK